MCVIERFHIVHPNGVREPQDRLINICDRGRPNAPCNSIHFVQLEDRFPRPAPRIDTISPRRDSRHENTRKPRGFFSGLRIGFSLENPFTLRRRYTSNSERPKLELVREKSRHSERVPRQSLQGPPQRPPQRPPQGPPEGVEWHPGPGPQEPQERPRIIPIPGPQEPRGRPRIIPIPGPQEPQGRPRIIPITGNMHRQDEQEDWHPRNISSQRPSLVVPVHFQDSDESPPYISPNRSDRRRARTHSPTRRYEENKQLVKERERREAAERAAQNFRRRNYHLDQEIEHRDQEIERLARERAIESDRKQRLKAAHDRLERDLRERDREEQERVARERLAGIRRQPRHGNVLHHGHVLDHGNLLHHGGRGSLEERGDRVIRGDIMAENHRREERERPRGLFRRRADSRGHRIRDRVAIGQRIVYDDDRMRGGRWA